MIGELERTIETLESQLASFSHTTSELASLRGQLQVAHDELGAIDELISRYSKDETQQRTAFAGVEELIEACLKMQAKVSGAEKVVAEMQEELLAQSTSMEEERQRKGEVKRRHEVAIEEGKKEIEGLQVRLLEIEVEAESRLSDMQVQHHQVVGQLKDQVFLLQQEAEKELKHRPPTDSEGLLLIYYLFVFVFFLSFFLFVFLFLPRFNY